MKKVQSLRNAVMVSLLAGTTVVWGGTVFAQEDLQEFALEDMVVTATRTESKMVDVPVNTTVISAEKIADRHYLDVADALKDVPGANVLDTGVGAGEKKVVLNGDDRVLVLVDGKRVNFDMGAASGRSSYDLKMLPDVSLIERIEVVKGHGGALYGSDAVGGVVNIITKKMDHSYGKVSMGFGSNQARDAKAMYTVKEGKTGVMVAASKYKQGYYKYKDVADKTTKRWNKDSDYENEKVSLKIAQELTDTSNLEFEYNYTKADGNVPYGYATTQSDKKTNNFGLKYDWLLKDKDAGYVQLYYNKYKFLSSSTLEEKDKGFEVQQAITASENNKLVVGASYRNAEASNDGRNYAAKYNEKINNKAIFVSDQWEFIPSWTLDTGVRYDKHSTAGSKTTWSAGLNKKFDENSHAYFNWGQVFKAPTLDDLYYNVPGMTGNPDLNPEKGDTWTVGYGTRIADKTDVNISYFQSDLEDAIGWSNKSGAWHPENVNKQKKNAMELSINHELNDNWNLEASYTHVRVRNDYGMGYLRDTNFIPNMYRFGVRYHDDLWNADLFLRGGSGADTGVFKNSYGYDAQNYLDSSFITLDASVSYKATKDLSFYAKGYNLFNKAYAESAGVSSATYTYPAQGRRFIIGAEYTF
ncbi:MAG: TonB-dependent receptor [Phascolarctobacterium succinatutens]|uniref:TonB-dependent receptor plug domain-containing protein n=1 Tax=Phascolarctobacterium succinatutens TaxID=626940 RepID=UPI002E78E58C|nr:TonB-dependent receptor [Phascolarctobacterium succinatutens]MEE0356100.1 TonB-dependent receptor [Phascolarctobacterium succinatutens]